MELEGSVVRKRQAKPGGERYKWIISHLKAKSNEKILYTIGVR